MSLRVFLFFTFLVAQPLQAESLASEIFSQLPKFTQVNISPNGKKIAFVQNLNNDSVLSVLDLQSRSVRDLVKSDNVGVRIRWFRWANDAQLLISLRHAGRRYGSDTTETRLYAMAVDGTDPEPRSLFKKNRAKFKERNSQFQDRVVDILPDDPNHVLIALDTDYFSQPSVFKLNINTARRESVEGGKKTVRRWITDQQHHVRVGNAYDFETGVARIYVRDKPGDKLVERFRYNSFDEPSITALGFGLDPSILFYLADHEGRQALFTLNLATDEKQLVFSHPEYDVDNSLIYSQATGDAIGIEHRTGDYLWNNDHEKLAEKLAMTFPGQFTDLVNFSRDERHFVLHVESDAKPGVYFLVDRNEFRFTRLFQQYPQLGDAVPLDHQLVEYKARDGLKIEGYLTRPAAAVGATPLILHPHGGPGTRDTGGFDYWTSFFVSRGYTVFRPNFRGSSGFGFKFEAAQMQSWGLSMQDDLEDAVAWLVAEEIVLANRVCVVGASYGGYAALMAAATSGDQFKCAVSVAGVSDLGMLVNKQRNYTNYDAVKNQIGSKSSDLRTRSPLYLAESIEIPLLLVHGEADRVVTVEQTKAMAKRLKKLKKPHKAVLLENGDHYLSIQKNRHKLFKEMDRFLAKHL